MLVEQLYKTPNIRITVGVVILFKENFKIDKIHYDIVHICYDYTITT